MKMIYLAPNGYFVAVPSWHSKSLMCLCTLKPQTWFSVLVHCFTNGSRILCNHWTSCCSTALIEIKQTIALSDASAIVRASLASFLLPIRKGGVTLHYGWAFQFSVPRINTTERDLDTYSSHYKRCPPIAVPVHKKHMIGGVGAGS